MSRTYVEKIIKITMMHAIMDKMEDTKSQLTMLIERGLFESTHDASVIV
ncbi:MAG: hypothetical protein KGI08_11545 [Thaumarchaeota archaeon]|nr:hypothetical protein [Nitrososphaerota archaeon]